MDQKIQSLSKIVGTPYDYSVLYDNYEILMKQNGLRPTIPQEQLSVVLANSCVKAI